MSPCYLPGTIEEVYNSQGGQWCLCCRRLHIFRNAHYSSTSSTFSSEVMVLYKKKMHSPTFISPSLHSAPHFGFHPHTFCSNAGAILFWVSFFLLPSHGLSAAFINIGYFIILALLLDFCHTTFFWCVCVCILFVFSLASLDTSSWCFFLVFFLTAHLHLNPCIFRFIGIHFSSNFIYSFQSDFSSIYLQVPNMYVSWDHYFFSSLNSNLPTALFGIFICHTSILIIFSLGQITSFLLSGPAIPTALPSFSIISI